MAFISISLAISEEIPKLDELIARSARILCAGYYDADAVAAAVAHVFGTDRLLVEAGHYFVARRNGEIVGCGGWSPFATMFGADRIAGRDDRRLDPATEAARIRAFFVAPEAARTGVGSAILDASEAAARASGFRATELMATLSGVPFYEARGYVAMGAHTPEYAGVRVPFVPMRKSLEAMESNEILDSVDGWVGDRRGPNDQ